MYGCRIHHRQSMKVILEAVPYLVNYRSVDHRGMSVYISGNWVYVYYLQKWKHEPSQKEKTQLFVMRLDDPLSWEKRDNVKPPEDIKRLSDEKSSSLDKHDYQQEHALAVTVATVIKIARGVQALDPDHIRQGLLRLGVPVEGWKITSNYLTNAVAFEIKQENSSSLSTAEEFFRAFKK